MVLPDRCVCSGVGERQQGAVRRQQQVAPGQNTADAKPSHFSDLETTYGSEIGSALASLF